MLIAHQHREKETLEQKKNALKKSCIITQKSDKNFFLRIEKKKIVETGLLINSAFIEETRLNATRNYHSIRKFFDDLELLNLY